MHAVRTQCPCSAHAVPTQCNNLANGTTTSPFGVVKHCALVDGGLKPKLTSKINANDGRRSRAFLKEPRIFFVKDSP